MTAERKNPNLSNSRADQTPTTMPKSQRILACVSCQQRKVKCDRKFPCANCLRQRIQCVPATQTRPRKRRFPERELLNRLKRYEELLRLNNVKFDPMHSDANPSEGLAEERSEDEEPDDQLESSPSISTRSENAYEPK